jgi:hypothetical protein
MRRSISGCVVIVIATEKEKARFSRTWLGKFLIG